MRSLDCEASAQDVAVGQNYPHMVKVPLAFGLHNGGDFFSMVSTNPYKAQTG